MNKDAFFYSYQKVKKSDIFWLQKKSKMECGPLTPFLLKYVLCGPIKGGESSFVWPYVLSGPIYEQKNCFLGENLSISQVTHFDQPDGFYVLSDSLWSTPGYMAQNLWLKGL